MKAFVLNEYSKNSFITHTFCDDNVIIGRFNNGKIYEWRREDFIRNNKEYLFLTALTLIENNHGLYRLFSKEKPPKRDITNLRIIDRDRPDEPGDTLKLFLKEATYE